MANEVGIGDHERVPFSDDVDGAGWSRRSLREGYYLKCLAAGEDEYYLAAAERPGYWLGAAAGRLGLDGRVTLEEFRTVLAGDPRDGTGLVPGAGGTGRVSGFDLTFSPPKSVSIAWALAEPGLSERIAAAHDRAVADAMTAIEAEVIRARRGHGGLRQVETEGVVAAAFTHRTSRAGDPQLHTHVVVANLTVDGNGRWSAPDGRRIYGWRKTVGYLYRAALRQNLTEDLGVAWQPVRKGAADLVGFTPDQLAGFSQRRAQITAALDQLGFTSAKAAAASTLATRPPKDPAASLADLRAEWAQRAQAMDIGDVNHLFGRAGPELPPIEPLVEQLVALERFPARPSTSSAVTHTASTSIRPCLDEPQQCRRPGRGRTTAAPPEVPIGDRQANA